MVIDKLIAELGYTKSPNFIQGDDLGRAGDYAHIFRRAKQRMHLRGAYVLQQPTPRDSQRKALVPVVYVCDARDDAEARDVQRLAWNQNAAPFLIVRTPAHIRLFSSFNCQAASAEERAGGVARGVLDKSVEFGDIASALSAFTSQSIDDGTLWRECGRFVTPERRVDESLLDSLRKLDESLIKKSGLEWRTSHALIGKYVYLWYLRQRSILSDGRLSDWGIEPDDVFSRAAKLPEFKRLLDELDNWLNGSVFPLDWTREAAPRQEHL